MSTRPDTPETQSPEALREQKATLLTHYKALKEKHTYADNDCDRGFIAEEQARLATQIKTLARRIETLEGEEA